jgi:hypothetical protein
MKMDFTISLDSGHYDALMVIISEAYPFADDRNLGPVFEEWIEDYLCRENGRLGMVVNGEWRR